MITKKKKYTLYYVMALACGLVASFFIYSCSADGYYSDEIEKNEVTNTRALSSKMINNGSTLIAVSYTHLSPMPGRMSVRASPIY